MDRIVFSFSLFLLGLLNLVLSVGTFFFHITPTDNWHASAMLAFGLVLCLVSVAMLQTGTGGRIVVQVVHIYGSLLFVYGLVVMALSVYVLFFVRNEAPDGRLALVALVGLGACLLGSLFVTAGE